MGQKLCKAIIFAGPSGSGKTTIARHLVDSNERVLFSISACTRAKRSHEIHGKDYYFLSIREFKRKIEQEAFIEWEEVYAKHYYGTLKSEVENIWAKGKAAIFDMDVQGGLKLKSYFKEAALAVYIKVPSIQLLAERLRERKTESEEDIARRMRKATNETALAPKFDTILTNGNLSVSFAKARTLARQIFDVKRSNKPSKC